MRAAQGREQPEHRTALLLAGWFAIVIGAAALAGWTFRLPFLVRPPLSASGMSFSTALSFVLAGAAWIAVVSGRTTHAKWLAALTAMVVIATIASGHLGLNLSIGGLLHLPGPTAAPFTALGLIAVAVAVMMLDRTGKGNLPVDAAIAGVAMIPLVLGLIPIVSRGLGMIDLRAWGPHFGAMALQTAVGLSGLGSGCLLVVWQRTSMGDRSGRYLTLPVAASVAVGLVCWALFDSVLTVVQNTADRTQAIDRTLEIDIASSLLEVHLRDMDLIRERMLHGAASPESLTAAALKTKSDYNALLRLSSGTTLARQVEGLRAPLEKELAWLQETSSLRPAPATGKPLDESLAAQFANMDAAIAQSIRTLTDANPNTDRALRRNLISSWIVCVAFIGASLSVLWLELRRRLRAEAILRRSELELAERVAQRTSELRAEIEENYLIQARLSESEVRFRSTFDQAAVGLCHATPEGTFIRVNDKFCGITGYRCEELIDTNFGNITYPPDLEADWAQANALLRGDISTYSIEKRYCHRDGRLIWINMTVSLVRKSDGTPYYFIAVVEDISARKQAERQLQESELRYRRLFEASMVGIVETRRSGDVLGANAAFYSLLGWTREEFAAAGMSLRSVTPGEWLETTDSHIQRAMDTGRPTIFEKEYFKKDGTRVPVMIGLSFSGKQFGEGVVFVLDLTSLKRTEQRLRASERRFRLVVEAAPSALIMIAADGCITMVNAQAEKLFGYRREEILGRPVDLLAPVSSRGRNRQWREEYLEKATARPMGEDGDLFGLRKDGSQVPVEIGLSPITTDEGRFVLASVVDITERKQMHDALRRSYGELELRVQERTKELSAINEALSAEIEQRGRAEHALQESEESFRTLAESVPQLVWICNPEGLNVYFNQRWVEYTGLTLKESYGTGWSIPFHPDDKQPAWNTWNQAVKSGETYRIECRLRKSDGSYHWFLTKGVPMRDGAGGIVKWFGTCTDIDDLKRAQEEQARSLQEKETLLKEIHHRVKNNLQVICSLLSMQLSNSAEPVSSPLNDAYSRIQAMALIHEEIYQSDTLAHLDLSTYIEHFSARLFDLYCVDRSHIRLELRLETVQMTVDDAIPCGLILNELLSNSLKHGFPSGRDGVIQISLRRTGDGSVELEVADNGIGLPMDFRLDETQSLGLQVVQALVTQLGADLFVSGDAGAIFRLSWKLAEPRNPPVITPGIALSGD